MRDQDALAAALHEHACGATHGTPWEFCFRDHKRDAAALAASGWTLAPVMAEMPATFPLDVDTFLAGIDSPWHSPASREAWVRLFYRDMRTAAGFTVPTPDPLRDALLDSLRVRTSDYNYRPLSDRERDLLAAQPAPDPLREAERNLIHAARDVDGAWDAEDHDGAPIQWYAEAGEVLADLRTAVIAHEKALGLYAAPARPDVECPHCDVRHEWPCPTIPRCDQQGCEDEATCGWPTPSGLAYRHTCGKHATGLGQRRPSRPDGEPR